MFRTKLYAVSHDGSESEPLNVGFEWKTNAMINQVKQNGKTVKVGAGGKVLDFKFFGLK